MRRFFLLTLFLLANCGSDDEFGPASVQAAAPEAQGFPYLRKETFSCGGQTHTVPIYRHEKTGLEFVQVPGGEFTMGSPDGESGRHSDEGPQRRVQVKPFLLCRTEVTQAVWDKIGGSDPRNWRGSDLPIEQVSWEDVTAWCKKAGLRLPTEAEWEYACRAGTASRFCFGDTDGELSDYAWYSGGGGRQTHPVGQKRPNAFGLFDMHGNVWEWCEDWYQDSYRGAPTDGSAWLGGSSFRVNRGGGWVDVPKHCRSAIRNWSLPGYRLRDLGFRPSSPLR